MIFIRIKGGLGNQLFQYAFAKSISINLNSELFLDVSYFNHDEQRKHVVFGLNSFNITGIIGYYPYPDEAVTNIGHYENQKITKYVEGIFPNHIYKYEIIKTIDGIKLPAFFDGYFQTQIKKEHENLITENFFKNNINIIHDDLKYIKSLSPNFQILTEEMENYDSIALHIRHGDYEELSNFGLCSLEYYQNAIDILTQKLDNPKFYIFTEDPNWAKENLKFETPYKIIIFNELKNVAGRGYGELLNVMSSCKHFIIANSTFSWWGAFLSENEKKNIIAPTPWFQDRKVIGCDTIDNIKTIDIVNNYKNIYENSTHKVYELHEDNVDCENIELIKNNNSLNLIKLNDESKLYLRNFNQNSTNLGFVIKIALKSKCFNCLKIYYKTNAEDYCEKNSKILYYYKDDDFTHYIIIPSKENINEIMIKPYTMINEDNEFIQINSLEIKEL